MQANTSCLVGKKPLDFYTNLNPKFCQFFLNQTASCNTLYSHLYNGRSFPLLKQKNTLFKESNSPQYRYSKKQQKYTKISQTKDTPLSSLKISPLKKKSAQHSLDFSIILVRNKTTTKKARRKYSAEP